MKTFQNLLDDAWRANKAEFVILTGKLRTGKTHLVRSFISGKHALYLSGETLPAKELLRQYLQPFRHFVQSTAAGDSKDLKIRAAQMTEDDLTWEALLATISEIGRTRRVVLVLDEFQHMAAPWPKLPRLLGRTWERDWKSSKIFLIVASSDVEFMRAHTQGFKATFHGRFTREIVTESGGFYDTLPQLRHYRDVDRIGVYSILGGVPLYLNRFNDKLDVLENIRQKILAPGSFLMEEPRRILLEELGQPRNFLGILCALSRGMSRVRQVVDHTGLDKGMVSKYLDVLQERGLVERELPLPDILDKKAGSRKGLYRVKSNFLRFYLRFLMPNRDLLDLGKTEYLLNKVIKPGLDAYIEEQLRFIFREYLEHLGRDGRIGWKFSQVGSWWEKDHFLDILATDGRGRFVIGACSWHNEPAGEEMFERVIGTLPLLKLKGPGRIVPILFNRGGFGVEVKRHTKERNLFLIELKDIVKDKI
jgi:AAA+ ATPase superfamily predicted ATPase